MLAVSKSAQQEIYVAWKLELHADLIRVLNLRGSLKNLHFKEFHSVMGVFRHFQS